MNKLKLLFGLSIVLVTAMLAGARPDGAEARRHGNPMYVALGDEIAAGLGLSDPDEGYVSLFHEFLESRGGLHRETDVVNLAEDDSSIFDVVGSQLPIALSDIEERRSDKDNRNDVKVVTLDVGLLDLFAGLLVCSAEEGSPQGCASFLHETLTWHELFIDNIFDRLRAAGGPKLQIIVMTNYNPYLNPDCYYHHLVPAWDAGLEGGAEYGISEGMNDITRRLAAQYGARAAGVYGRIGAEHLPANCGDTFSPDEEGHAVIAAEFAKAFRAKKHY